MSKTGNFTNYHPKRRVVGEIAILRQRPGGQISARDIAEIAEVPIFKEVRQPRF
jgi:hypothetical protein